MRHGEFAEGQPMVDGMTWGRCRKVPLRAAMERMLKPQGEADESGGSVLSRQGRRWMQHDRGSNMQREGLGLIRRSKQR